MTDIQARIDRVMIKLLPYNGDLNEELRAIIKELQAENNALMDIVGKEYDTDMEIAKLKIQIEELQAQLVELQKKISNVQDVTNIQCSKGNWDYDSYMRGMANGLICAMAILNNIEPIYLEPSKGI